MERKAMKSEGNRKEPDTIQNFSRHFHIFGSWLPWRMVNVSLLAVLCELVCCLNDSKILRVLFTSAGPTNGNCLLHMHKLWVIMPKAFDFCRWCIEARLGIDKKWGCYGVWIYWNQYDGHISKWEYQSRRLARRIPHNNKAGFFFSLVICIKVSGANRNGCPCVVCTFENAYTLGVWESVCYHVDYSEISRNNYWQWLSENDVPLYSNRSIAHEYNDAEIMFAVIIKTVLMVATGYLDFNKFFPQTSCIAFYIAKHIINGLV